MGFSLTENAILTAQWVFNTNILDGSPSVVKHLIDFGAAAF